MVGERRRRPSGRCAPQAQSELGRGPTPFPSPLLHLPSSPTPTREGGNLLLLGVGIPFGECHREGRPSPPPLLYIRGRGHPIDTQVDLLAVCGAPSIDFHLGHIVVVLRRSLASVTSSPSPCRHADETLPRPQLDQEYEGRHRAERVQIAEVPCVRYLIGCIAKTFDYINRVT